MHKLEHLTSIQENHFQNCGMWDTSQISTFSGGTVCASDQGRISLSDRLSSDSCIAKPIPLYTFHDMTTLSLLFCPWPETRRPATYCEASSIITTSGTTTRTISPSSQDPLPQEIQTPSAPLWGEGVRIFVLPFNCSSF